MSTVKKPQVNLKSGISSAKKFGDEFKQFAMKGNVLDLAIGVIIGGAFGKIVTSLVNDLLMPLIVLITGQSDLKEVSILLRKAVGADGKDLLLTYGNFLQTVIDFLIIALSIFLFVKFLSRFKKKETEAVPPAPAVPTSQEKLLAEIRDELKRQNRRQ
jgi:large conductance mechanosensitive channel